MDIYRLENSPIPATVEDWSEAKRIIDRLLGSGVTDVIQYVRDHPKILAELAPAVKVLNVNRAAVKVYGAASKRDLIDIFNAPPDLTTYNPETGLSDIFVTLLDRFSKGEVWVELEGPDTTTDGDSIYIRASTTIAVDHESDWSLVFQTVEDFTEKKKAQETAREHEERYKLAIEGAHDGMWDWQIDKDKFFASANMARVTGISKFQGYLPSEQALAWVHPDDLGRVEEALKFHLLGKTDHFACEHRMNRPDGDDVWVLNRGLALRNEDGHAHRIAGSISNITERKKAEEAVRNSEELYRRLYERTATIVETLPDVLFVLDEDGRYVEVIAGGSDLLYAEKSIIQGKTIFDILPEDVAKTLHVGICDALKSGGLCLLEYPLEVPAGKRYFEARITPIQGHENEKKQVLFIGRDITERVEVDREKSEFVSTVSHELRTPLTAMMGSIGMLKGNVIESLPEQAQELLDVARRNTERLIDLVNDILDFEKLETGSMEFDMRPLELSGLVNEVVETNRGLAELHGVNFVFTEPQSEIMVRADGDRLTQVLANLLSNAAKFSHKDGRIEISVSTLDGEAIVSVSDQGLGIPEEFREHIFDRFTQADSRDNRQKGGTGLGLSIAKSIIEKHHGTIGFDGKANAGSTFFFTLPLLD